jgi:hypothetical protein
MLLQLTTARHVVTISNMKATELFRQRIVYAENRFAELVLWRLPKPAAGSAHSFKYRLAYVVNGACVLRYDNEAGKGDHQHRNGKECAYAFSGPEQLLADFHNDIQRWNHENGHS